MVNIENPTENRAIEKKIPQMGGFGSAALNICMTDIYASDSSMLIV